MHSPALSPCNSCLFYTMFTGTIGVLVLYISTVNAYIPIQSKHAYFVSGHIPFHQRSQWLTPFLQSRLHHEADSGDDDLVISADTYSAVRSNQIVIGIFCAIGLLFALAVISATLLELRYPGTILCYRSSTDMAARANQASAEHAPSEDESDLLAGDNYAEMQALTGRLEVVSPQNDETAASSWATSQPFTRGMAPTAQPATPNSPTEPAVLYDHRTENVTIGMHGFLETCKMITDRFATGDSAAVSVHHGQSSSVEPDPPTIEHDTKVVAFTNCKLMADLKDICRHVLCEGWEDSSPPLANSYELKRVHYITPEVHKTSRNQPTSDQCASGEPLHTNPETKLESFEFPPCDMLIGKNLPFDVNPEDYLTTNDCCMDTIISHEESYDVVSYSVEQVLSAALCIMQAQGDSNPSQSGCNEEIVTPTAGAGIAEGSLHNQRALNYTSNTEIIPALELDNHVDRQAVNSDGLLRIDTEANADSKGVQCDNTCKHETCVGHKNSAGSHLSGTPSSSINTHGEQTVGETKSHEHSAQDEFMPCGEGRQDLHMTESTTATCEADWPSPGMDLLH